MTDFVYTILTSSYSEEKIELTTNKSHCDSGNWLILCFDRGAFPYLISVFQSTLYTHAKVNLERQKYKLGGKERLKNSIVMPSLTVPLKHWHGMSH